MYIHIFIDIHAPKPSEAQTLNPYVYLCTHIYLCLYVRPEAYTWEEITSASSGQLCSNSASQPSCLEVPSMWEVFSNNGAFNRLEGAAWESPDVGAQRVSSFWYYRCYVGFWVQRVFC